jgi:hypothetical protein
MQVEAVGQAIALKPPAIVKDFRCVQEPADPPEIPQLEAISITTTRATRPRK